MQFWRGIAIFRLPFSRSTLTKRLDDFVQSDQGLLHINLSGIVYEHHARSVVTNVIERHLLNMARLNAHLQSLQKQDLRKALRSGN